MAKTSRSARRSVITAVSAIACIPLLYGGALVWSNQDPIDRLDQVPAAVVNLDQPTVSHGQTVDLGSTIEHNLVTAEDEDNFNWSSTDAASASAGLASGKYLAVLTLPAQLSADAVSLGADDPTQARASTITVTTNDAQNYIVGTIAKTVGTAVASSASAEVSKQYLDQVYLGFNELSGKLGQAADGARQLASGAADLQSGTATLASGAASAASGAHDLAGGLSTLSDGAHSLSSGTAAVSTGAKSLASGATTLSGGATQLASGTAAVASGAKTLDGGLGQLQQQTAQLPASASALSSGAKSLAGGVADYTAGVDQLADACTTLTGSPDPAVQQLCAGIAQVAGAHGADGYANSVQLTAGSTELQSGAGKLADSAPALKSAVGQLADGASTLADGAHSAASGAAQLADGAASARSGAATLADGAADAASGASSLATAAAQAAAGAATLADGTAQLSSGANAAHSGAAQLATGGSTLASSLVDGESAVPNYTKAQRALLTNAASQPVKLTDAHNNAVPGYGYGLAPYFLSLGLWVGGMGIYMVLRAVPKRLVDRGAPAWWTAVAGYLRGAAIAAVQAVLMYAAVVFGVGVHPVHPVGLMGLLLLAALSFTAANHAFVTLFGSRGRFAGLILIVLQLSSAGATYPIQTTPSVFQALHGWLPISYSVEAIRSLIAGGDVGVVQSVIVLSAWLVGAVAASVGVTVWRRMRGAELLQPDFAI